MAFGQRSMGVAGVKRVRAPTWRRAAMSLQHAKALIFS